MSNFETKSLNTLEYHKIREMLLACAHTEGGRKKCLRIFPSDDYDQVIRWQEETAAAVYFAEIKGMPSFGAVVEPYEFLQRAQKGAMLTTLELLSVAKLLRSARQVKAYLTSDREIKATCIDFLFKEIVPDKEMEEKIFHSIPEENQIADDASPELWDLRKKMKNVNNRIKDHLQKMITGSAYTKFLQENIVTMRNGRYVVPVKAEYKNEVKGLVHDTSASGATLFIEPVSIVEANNELRFLEISEQKEIEKILFALSAECAAREHIITFDFERLIEIDYIFARAQLSFHLNASRPTIVPTPKIKLFGARHPLLNKDTVVPIDVELGESFRTLMITGPNTGGKTVTLKTLGLFALMAQSGLQIPAKEYSELGVFGNVLADIGDEQSIEQSLSTFSAHMVNIVSILKAADERSLVLFDELGAGTDPVEGAALAMAILETVKNKGVLCAATTHYSELKIYAIETENVCNASCEFDIATLKPTYRLMIGLPGKSNAFAISKRLGLDEAVIDQARTYVSSDKKKFEDVVENLERQQSEMEKDRIAMHQLRKEYEQMKQKMEEEFHLSNERISKELEKARANAVRIVESARATSSFVMNELEKVKKKRDSELLAQSMEATKEAIRKRLKDSEDEVNPVIERTGEGYVLPRKLKEGDSVYLFDINKDAVVVSVSDKSDQVTVKIGNMTMRTELKNLKLNDGKQNHGTKAKPSKEAVLHTISSFSPEIDLRGMTCDDAWFAVDKYLDDAMRAHLTTVTLIHGKGTGALRTYLTQMLKKDKRVKSSRPGAYGEGDYGVTVVEIK